ncbi:MAG: hypothetical protein IAE80_23340 [Anaerolinea sp.]|nr:hypothetical protein [Anaerolinea sp.]
MKLKLLTAALFVIVIVVLFPLSAQESPTSAPTLFTNTPTVGTATSTVTPTALPTESSSELVNVELLDRATFDGQRFQITAMYFERTPNALLSVSVTVKNISDLPASGVVWYLLAPPGVIDAPWTQAIYTAESLPIVDLTAQETRTFTFGAPEGDVVGEFSLSAWVHQTEADGSSIHSDGVGYGGTVLIVPSVYMNVQHVDYLPTETGETLVFVTMRLYNFNPLATEVGYSYTLAAPDDPTPWETGVFTLPFQSIMLLPGQTLNVTTRDLILLPKDEDLQVIGWLQERVGDEMQFRNNDPYP